MTHRQQFVWRVVVWRVVVGLVALVALSSVWSCTPSGGSPLRNPFALGQAVADEADLEVRTLESSWDRARDILNQHFGDFLAREPLGFDWTLVEHLADDVQHAATWLAELPSQLVTVSALTVLAHVLPLFILVLFLGLIVVLDRQLEALAVRVQARVHSDLSAGLTEALRGGLLVVGRCTAPLVLVIPSYFPVQALFNQAPWTVLLSTALWLFAIYRAVHAAIVVAFSGRMLDVPLEHAERLERFGTRLAAIVFTFALAMATIEIFGYREDVYNLVAFVFNLTLALAAATLFVLRRSVLAMLPETNSSAIYRLFRATLERFYNWIVAITLALFLLNAAGFVTAARFLLVRGYAILVILTLTLAGMEKFRRYVRARGEADGAQPSQLFRATEQLLTVVGTIVLVVLVLRLLAVYEALIELLKVPLIAIGRVEFSLFHLLNVALIIGSAVLITRLIKAVLNARVYPALNVDIGVAYAVNTLINYALILVAFFMSLFALGVHLSAIIVVLASLGVGIGFALQAIIENVVSGFIILFGRSVKKGDFITVNDIYGQVEAVGARSVVMRTPDNYDLLVPSRDIVGGQVINWTYRDAMVRIQIPVRISYEHHPRHVEQVLLDACQRFPEILQEPPPEVWLREFAPDAMYFALVVYFDCRQISEPRLRGLFNFYIWDALEEAGITIPLPQQAVHIRTSKPADEAVRRVTEPHPAIDDE